MQFDDRPHDRDAQTRVVMHGDVSETDHTIQTRGERCVQHCCVGQKIEGIAALVKTTSSVDMALPLDIIENAATFFIESGVR